MTATLFRHVNINLKKNLIMHRLKWWLDVISMVQTVELNQPKFISIGGMALEW